MASLTIPLSQSFISKKRKILEQLAVPVSDYDDLSPKGSVDEGIRDFINEINDIEGCVTTSSCAGRVSVFLEGSKDIDNNSERYGYKKESKEAHTQAGIGGKGGGGKWLYVSHRPLDQLDSYGEKLTVLFGMHERVAELGHKMELDSKRLVHFKFEPMILHILTVSSQQAQVVLSAALQAGFRESGAINLVSSSNEPATPMVAVRSNGLSLESIVGCELDSTSTPSCIVPEETLKFLVDIANKRFEENTKRTERFRALLKKLSVQDSGDVRKKGQEGEKWEDPQIRRERKRAEGMMKSLEMKNLGMETNSQPARREDSDLADLQLLDQNT